MIDAGKLEPFKEVLRRQVPRELGKPISMKAYNIEHPKNCGNAWNGAYSKHGFWYKFYEGNSNDFDKVVALSYETDNYCMNYGSYDLWKTAFGDAFSFIVAKNLREDVIGSIAFVCYNDTAIVGVFYVVEDYRHSGIGSVLFTEAIKRLSHKNILFHSSNHLSDKSSRFGLCASGWTFNHYVVDKPSGLQSLQVSEINLKRLNELTALEKSALFNYDKGVCNVERSQWSGAWLQHADSDTVVAFSNDEAVIGFGNARELAGGFVKRLMVGPLYADNETVANAILFALLVKFYNPEDDHEWDPDVFAINRRSVHFVIPEDNSEMLRVIRKLKGDTGTVARRQLCYKSGMYAKVGK